MTLVEIPEELAESIADMIGIHDVPTNDWNPEIHHKDNCKCRICFVSNMTKRIKDSVKAEYILNKLHEQEMLR